MNEHRRNIEAIYREGFEDIANAIKALTTPTIIAELGISGDRCTNYQFQDLANITSGVRCTRHEGHTGNHCADDKEWP